MQEFDVPVFHSVVEFNRWAKAQKPAAIRQWRTDDWLDVFYEIDALVKVDPSIEKQAKDKGCSKANAFVEAALTGLGHLYRNYRFEEEQYRTICQKAVEAGKALARSEDGGSFDPAMLATDLNKDEQVRHNTHRMLGGQVVQIMQDASALDDYTVPTEVDDQQDAIGWYDGDKQSIFINSEETDDEAVTVWFHEATHAYFQVESTYQKQEWKADRVAIPELGSDFHELMLKNGRYYIGADLVDDYEMYSKQPVEKYAQLFGTVAERAYRQESGYLSERGAMKIANELKEDLGQPKEAWYEEDSDRIVLRYGQTGERTALQIRDILHHRFSKLDKESRAQLDLHLAPGPSIQISVPADPQEAATLVKQMIPWRSAQKTLEPLDLKAKTVPQNTAEQTLGQACLKRFDRAQS
jgi:hypothetical protein